MPDAAHEEIGRKLRNELRRTQSEHAVAKERFNGIANQTPSGLPHPDGALRIQQAGREYRRSIELYTRALKHYTDFTIHGIAPPPLNRVCLVNPLAKLGTSAPPKERDHPQNE